MSEDVIGWRVQNIVFRKWFKPIWRVRNRKNRIYLNHARAFKGNLKIVMVAFLNQRKSSIQRDYY